jgi:hypothetical protein
VRAVTLDAGRCCTGQIEAGDLLVALRSLGFEPRKDEVKKLMSDNDKDNSGKINKQQFVEIFRAKWVSLDRRVRCAPALCQARRVCSPPALGSASGASSSARRGACLRFASNPRAAAALLLRCARTGGGCW